MEHLILPLVWSPELQQGHLKVLGHSVSLGSELRMTLRFVVQGHSQ